MSISDRPLRSRVALLVLTVLLLCASVLYAALYRVQEIKPNIFVWLPDDVIDQGTDPRFSRAATSGFIVTSEGVLLVDTSNSPMNARDLLYEIRRRSQLPVRYVINTSSAPDHMLGNEVFTDEQATLISSKAAQAEMEDYRQDVFARMRAEGGWRLQARMRGFHVTPSTQTFEEKMTLNFGGLEFRIDTPMRGVNPTDDAVVYLPAAKVLFLGELFDNQYFPRVGSRNVYRWIEVLRQLEGWDVDVYVPGHGAPGSKKDLVDFRKFLEWVVAQVEMRLKQGQTPEEIPKLLRLPRVYNWRAPDLSPETVADICRQLAPPSLPSFPAGGNGR
jgi:glyoxylase-like metal-dependent hydrolase (beta-lactamase superfamily II)